MTRRSTAQKHRVAETTSRIQVAPSGKKAQTSDGLTIWLERLMPEILAITYWFDLSSHAEPSPITVRFSGHRVDAGGRLSGERFVQDEIIEQVVPGSGPISITARIRGITAGTWSVSAHPLSSAHAARKRKSEQGNVISVTSPLPFVVRWWHKWAPNVSSSEQAHTCLLPLARVPGIIPGIWGVMVILGMVVALVLQSLVISLDHLILGPAWIISLVAIAVGTVGAKLWFIVLKWREHLFNGWCIQGFIASAPPTAVILLVLLHIPVGTFLDVTAPGLLIAMAVGRVGCFFAGCCGGPPTASRFGVWSSDQRVGARRLPTQLLEMGLALIAGLLVLVAVLLRGPAGGAYFAAGLAAYTLGRQGILQLRAELRKTKFGGLVTAVLAVLVLIIAIILLAS